ncbi:(-)-alpha-terpineol synthase-like isoform X2 [Rhododendron vialii]|uniref:(-)-alpha-terpineol synthase-like isoform X2 n=1 Tax=Rhododendron vialii TaxID=182163 RepID=UPI00265FD179|nr:(-)-alpha-terpineol synthase-like isoform X2 [Rhododendron vialii]
MALALTSTVPTSLYTHFRLTSQVFITPVKSIRGQVPHTVRSIGVSPKTSDEKIVRRTANWQPPIWDYDYLQSLNSKYVGDKYVTRATKLKEDVKKILTEVVDPLDGLEIIDDLQRLGVFYHFEEEIKRVLESIYNSKRDGNEDGLHATSLKFRLLRQHGYNVPQDVFENFMDETGHFKASLCEDIRGMLYLYEASFLSFSGESIMEEAKDFATKNLEQYLKRKDIDQVLASLVSHALELPLHWRLPRLEARWFIDMCERRPNMNPMLLQLAKLDFNMVQATHQEDLKHALRWDISAMEQLPDYMKICFLALFNSINEIAYETLKEQDAHIIPHLRKV